MELPNDKGDRAPTGHLSSSNEVSEVSYIIVGLLAKGASENHRTT